MVQRLLNRAKNGDGEINPWIIALTVMLATFMEVLDTSIANVALNHIAGSLSASVDESTWVLTSYLVSNAIILPMAGWFSSLMGRKRFYMICVALFTFTSLLCGLAPNLGSLIFFRVLQGIGGGAMQPIAQAILVESFPTNKRGMAMAVYGMGVVLAPIIGPTLGGWITDNYSWRWIFFINIPVGFLALALTQFLIFDPSYLKRHSVKTGLKVDYIGFGLLAVGLGALEIMLDEGQRHDWFGSTGITAAAIVAALCLLLVVLWELRTEHPVVELRLLKNRNFTLATITMYFLGFVLYASTVLLPIYLQTLMGYNATLSGLVLSPGGVVVLFLMPIVGFMLSKFEARWLVTFGVAMCSLGMYQMAQFNLDTDYRTAMMARVVQSVGMAFLFVPINTAAFSYLAKEQANNATGIINLARNIGGSSGIALTLTMLTRRTAFHQNMLAGHITGMEEGYRSMVQGATGMLVAQGSDPVQAAQQAHGLLYGLLMRQSAMKGFIDSFFVLALLFLLMIPLMFLMKKAHPNKGELAAH